MEDQSFVAPVLPLDCFVEIASHLCGVQYLFNFSQVCKTFHEIVDNVFDFKTVINVDTPTLIASRFVCPPWFHDRQRTPIENVPMYSIGFSDHMVITIAANADIDYYMYEFYCTNLYLSIGLKLRCIFIRYDDGEDDRLILEYDSTGKWLPAIDETDLAGENYYKNLPFILDCLEELQAWKNYCDRK